jgi:RNA polymerase sigma factor (sigma-70 family)
VAAAGSGYTPVSPTRTPGRRMPSAYPPSELTVWLGRHKTGDPRATNELIRHSQDRLKHLTRQMLRRFPGVHRWEDTSDVFQNVLIRLDRALRALTFDTPDHFLRLAACHIRRELIDLARKPRPELPSAGADPAASDPAPADPPDSTNDPYQLALWHEVHTRIDGLPDDDRRLFDLLYYQGLSQPEAAVLLNVPLRTLKRNWQTVRVRLMLLFGNQPPF